MSSSRVAASGAVDSLGFTFTGLFAIASHPQHWVKEDFGANQVRAGGRKKAFLCPLPGAALFSDQLLRSLH
jgi:hypothetical protein